MSTARVSRRLLIVAADYRRCWLLTALLLLKIFLNDFRWPLVRAIRVLPEFLTRPPLAHQIPQPVQLHVDGVEAAPVVDRHRRSLFEERVLLGNEALDELMKFLIGHAFLLPTPANAVLMDIG